MLNIALYVMSKRIPRLITRYFPYAFDPVGLLTAAGLSVAAQQPILQLILPQRDYKSEECCAAGNHHQYSLDVELRMLWQSLVPNQPLSHAAIELLGLTAERTTEWKRIVDDIDSDGGYCDHIRHIHDVIHCCMEVPISEFVLEDGRTLLNSLGL